MQAAHPVAFAGFFAHTGALDEPYERLARTARVMDLDRLRRPAEDADRLTAPRARHAPPRARRAGRAGRAASRPARPTRPTIPALLLWILAALVDSAAVVYQRYVRRAEPRRARRAVGRLPRRRAPVRPARDATCPATGDDFEAYMARHGRGRATCTSPTRRASWRSRSSCARRSRCALRPLLELANQITVGLLPAAPAPPVRLRVGPGARGRGARRRRVRQALRGAVPARAPARGAQRAAGRCLGRPLCAGALRGAYSITEGKRTRGGATVAVVLGRGAGSSSGARVGVDRAWFATVFARARGGGAFLRYAGARAHTPFGRPGQVLRNAREVRRDSAPGAAGACGRSCPALRSQDDR